MGNLGWYQKITEISHKVKGPLNLLGLTFIAGGVVFEGIRLGYKTVRNATRRDINNPSGPIYNIIADGITDDGVLFSAGEQVQVLAADGDSVLIIKISDPNTPHYVSADFLSSISSYPL